MQYMVIKKKTSGDLRLFRIPTFEYVSQLIFVAAMLAASPTNLFALGDVLNPSSEGQIIAVLEKENISPKMSLLKDQLRQRPNDEIAARELIAEYLKLSKQSGDERYLGYAMAIVNNWSDQTKPESIQLLQARIIQRQHHFSEALEIVNRVLTVNAKSGEAYLLAAYIYMAQGELELAAKYCSQTTRWLGSGQGLNCSSRVQGLSGQGEKAFQLLRVILNDAADFVDSNQVESYLNLAEIAIRLGKEEQAEKYYRFVIDASKTEPALLEHQAVNGLADLLLAQGRYQECSDLLRKSSLSLPQSQWPLLLIQNAQVKFHLGMNARAEKEKLNYYFELEQLRNQSYASREYARYLLEIVNDSQHAFTIALENWQTQREPDDLLVLVSSAIAAEKTDEISEILAWRKTIRLEDRRLDQILSEIH